MLSPTSYFGCPSCLKSLNPSETRSAMRVTLDGLQFAVLDYDSSTVVLLVGCSDMLFMVRCLPCLRVLLFQRSRSSLGVFSLTGIVMCGVLLAVLTSRVQAVFSSKRRLLVDPVKL